jgi:hypothetical protein
MFAWSFSQGTGTFTATAGLTMNPNASATGEPTKVVVLQGFTHVTESDCVFVKLPIVTTRSTEYVVPSKARSFDCS